MELTLFVIVGAVAILSAAMMLISENAIYSALFLILNFACIAFFYLMLNAPFLAMVQVAVYAGAIMVLFLFVIMLLGAERVAPAPARFRWMVWVATALGVIFLVTASAAIVQGEIDLIEPREARPYVRVVHVLDLDGTPGLDLYLDDDVVAENVSFRDASDFEAWDAGRFTLRAFPAGADPTADVPLIETSVRLEDGNALSFTVIGRANEVRLATVAEDVSQNEDNDTLRMMAVNALPEWDAVDVWDDAGDRQLLIENVPYGEASEIVRLTEDKYTIGLYPHGDSRSRLLAMEDWKLDEDTSVLLVFSEQWNREANSFDDVIIGLETNTRPLFGGPEHVGQRLFSRYVLPFEMVALLLLVAMIGAIVLTHESLKPRRQVVRRFANPPAGLEQPITGEPRQ
jgi:NADH:ubiquinone oxidoreductase subunit 6 (subunit J)